MNKEGVRDMKRWLSAAAVLVLAGALAGCGAGASGGTEAKDTAASADTGEVKKNHRRDGHRLSESMLYRREREINRI
ncbi:hypothetical protein POTG_01864 [Paenibacillus sp. oral taxon 786 str. D14]|nr:hypothetical protein POTG_01864 [Paenibacillus sp. oral taxon 786 str. D14]